MKSVYLNPVQCIGCGSCIDILPAYFYFDTTGKVALYGGAYSAKGSVSTAVFSEDEVFVNEAIEACPSKCILLK